MKDYIAVGASKLSGFACWSTSTKCTTFAFEVADVSHTLAVRVEPGFIIP